ncbi:DUF4296 domain-containing protein [Salinimicrobium sediminilitoris]|uniref:DUF4296 domain-containing protein n=1 Tax=Salinimicrobium sediminilitoris TaxID=2876715 RepID=UPI001E56F38D|nr:DUF4296 domain-containing protein [Salinimicrobium sediminilitoris]MCC8360966.1 DUF4296 domain-containing protein [Salinimicrobium sediminilitoris]
MKKLLGVLTALILLASCQDIDRTPKPDNLIPEDKMVEVLTELSILHGARSYNKSLMEEKGINAYPYLTNKFGIDSVQLVQSNNYYAENYKEYQMIYDRVKERLEILMEQYDSIREVEKKKKDSLRRVPENDSIVPRKFINDTLVPRRINQRLSVPASQNQRQ